MEAGERLLWSSYGIFLRVGGRQRVRAMWTAVFVVSRLVSSCGMTSCLGESVNTNSILLWGGSTVWGGIQ